MEKQKRFFINKEEIFWNANSCIVNDCTDSINLYVEIGQLDALDRFPNIKYLIVKSGPIKSAEFEHIYRHEEIKGLCLDYYEVDGYSNYSVDLERLPNLRKLQAATSFDFVNADKCPSLKVITVKEWLEQDLHSLRGSSIECLSVIGKKLRSLDGIENSCLKVLSISYASITSIKAINMLPCIKFVEIDRCPKICDIGDLSSNSLEYILLLGNGAVKSLHFMDNIPKLSRMILELKVLDGDISRLTKLKHATIFTNHKHYNLKNNDLPKDPGGYLFNCIPQDCNIYLNRLL